MTASNVDTTFFDSVIVCDVAIINLNEIIGKFTRLALLKPSNNKLLLIFKISTDIEYIEAGICGENHPSTSWTIKQFEVVYGFVKNNTELITDHRPADPEFQS